MKQSRSANGVLLLLSVIWGSTWIANSMLPEPGAPLHTAVLRYSFSWVFVCFVYGLRLLVRRVRTPGSPHRKAEPAVPRSALQFDAVTALELRGSKDFAWIGPSILLGLSMFGLPDLLLVWASRHGATAWTPLIYASLPLGLVLAAGKLQGAAILGLGAMLVLLNGSLPLSAAKVSWALPIVAAVALQGWSLTYARRRLPVAGSLSGCMVQLLIAFCTMELALKLWPETGSLPVRVWPPSSIAAICMLAALATALAYPLYYRLLRTMEPAQLATSAWLQTLVAVGESAVLLHQRPGWSMIAAACVLVGCTASLLRQDSTVTENLLHLSS